MPSIASLFLSLIVFAAQSVLAIDTPDDFNALGYIPSKPAAVAFAAVYAIIAILMFIMMFRHRGWWLLAIPLGALAMAAGLGLRVLFADNPTKLGYYIAFNTPIVLSPCAFLAGTYIILGRLARWLHGEEYLFIRPQRVSTIFIWSDVITFLVQASGAGLSASSDSSKGKLGARIFLVGLILQLVSFCLFVVMLLVFLRNVRSRAPELWNISSRLGLGRRRDWRFLAWALCINCVGILIRSVYRVIEMSQGYGGALSHNEVLFYVLDTAPLAIAIGVLVFTWPQKYFVEHHLPVSMTAQISPRLK